MSRLSLSRTKAPKSTILKSRSLKARPEQTEKRVRISNVRFVYLPKPGSALRDASREETTALRESARRPRINLTWRWIRKHSEECALVHQNRGTVSMAPRLVRPHTQTKIVVVGPELVEHYPRLRISVCHVFPQADDWVGICV